MAGLGCLEFGYGGLVSFIDYNGCCTLGTYLLIPLDGWKMWDLPVE